MTTCSQCKYFLKHQGHEGSCEVPVPIHVVWFDVNYQVRKDTKAEYCETFIKVPEVTK